MSKKAKKAKNVHTDKYQHEAATHQIEVANDLMR